MGTVSSGTVADLLYLYTYFLPEASSIRSRAGTSRHISLGNTLFGALELSGE